MTAPPILVTGAPRSGTGYLAAVLRAAGVNAGHENWWGVRDQTPDLEVDVSWLGCFDTGYAGRRFAQVRDPRVAVPSIAATYSLHPWRLFAAQNVLLTGDKASDACRIWLRFTTAAVKQAEHWWRVEDITAADLAWSGVDCAEALAGTATDVNHRTPLDDFQWPAGMLVERVFDLADELGYS